MKTLPLILIFWTISISLIAQKQEVTAEITPFKNDATGAYTLIHDDFGTASGIENYADSIAHNRGIPIAFGAITSACDEKDWQIAKRMMKHGHEIINHSHRHYCGLPVDWCSTKIYTKDDYPIEFDKSTDLIAQNTGFRPTFYIFPFDLYNDGMFNYLEKIQFLGCRGGLKNELNAPNSDDFFRLNFHVFFPKENPDTLNNLAQRAVTEKKWAIRALHGVADDSWGVVGENDYRKHIEFLQQKVKSNELWVVNPSEIINYQINKLKFEPQITKNKKGWELIWQDKKTKQTASSEKITLKLDFGKTQKSPKSIKQNGKKIAFEKNKNGLILCNVLPTEGSLTIK